MRTECPTADEAPDRALSSQRPAPRDLPVWRPAAQGHPCAAIPSLWWGSPAAISGRQMIRLGSPKSEVQFEVVKPWNSGVNIFAFEDLRQVLIVLF